MLVGIWHVLFLWFIPSSFFFFFEWAEGSDATVLQEGGELVRWETPDCWWTWLRSVPAEAVDLRHCGRLQDFQPNYSCTAENASLYSHSSVWLFVWFSYLYYIFTMTFFSHHWFLLPLKAVKTFKFFHLLWMSLCHSLIQHFTLPDYRQLSTVL